MAFIDSFPEAGTLKFLYRSNATLCLSHFLSHFLTENGFHFLYGNGQQPNNMDESV